MKIRLIDEKGKTVDLSKENRSKAWVFVFPGKNVSLSGQNEDMSVICQKVAASIEGVKKRAEYIGINLDTVRFFGAYYDETARQYILDYNDKGTINPGVEKLADEIVEARLCFKEKLHKPIQAAAEMSGVGFFGHCFGGMIVASLEQALHNSLQKRGATEEASANILSSAKATLTNPMLRVERMPKFFDSFAFVNCSDAMLSENREYKEVRENLLGVGGFQDNQLFHYNLNSNLWRYPENPDMKYLRIKDAKRLHVLMASALDTPSKEMIDGHIRHLLGMKKEQQMSPEIWVNYIQLQNRYAGGHELRCLISPMNLRESPQAQKLQQLYLALTGEQLKKVTESQTAFNIKMKAVLAKKNKDIKSA